MKSNPSAWRCIFTCDKKRACYHENLKSRGEEVCRIRAQINTTQSRKGERSVLFSWRANTALYDQYNSRVHIDTHHQVWRSLLTARQFPQIVHRLICRKVNVTSRRRFMLSPIYDVFVSTHTVAHCEFDWSASGSHACFLLFFFSAGIVPPSALFARLAL